MSASRTREMVRAPNTTTRLNERLAAIWASRLDWGARWAARLVAVLGVVTIASAVSPPVRRRLDIVAELLSYSTPRVAGAAAAAGGVLLLMLSGGLRRRKRRAWQVAVIGSGVLVVAHVLKGLDIEEAVLSCVVLGLLLSTRRVFTGAPDPRSWRYVAAVAAGSGTLATIVGALLIVVRPRWVAGTPSLPAVVNEVWQGFAGIQGPLRFSHPWIAGRAEITLQLLGLAVVGVTLSAALRPAGGPHPLRPHEAERLRALLGPGTYHDSLGYFALRADKSVMFSATGKAAVAYRVIGGVSLASGDPIGDDEAWPAAIDAWLAEARRYAWAPAVLSASERGAMAYHRAGLDALELGDEAVLDVPGFSLDGRAMRNVRQTVRRARGKHGYTVRIDRAGDLSPGELADLAALAQSWRDGPVERGFSMALGRFGDPRDPDLVVVRCLDATGQVCGLQAFVPWGTTGLSLDLMRRAPSAAGGVVELMVASLVEHARSRGIAQVSLNFAVFRAVFERGERLGAGPILRIWHKALRAASRYWQLESLYRSNAKYQPRWQPRFLCFGEARDLPRILTAALRAESLLPRLPHLPRLPLRR